MGENVREKRAKRKNLGKWLAGKKNLGYIESTQIGLALVGKCNFPRRGEGDIRFKM
jgi:hypothetical protein